jgi:hypothetical protein
LSYKKGKNTPKKIQVYDNRGKKGHFVFWPSYKIGEKWGFILQLYENRAKNRGFV